MEPLTHSKMQTVKNCPMYFYWRHKKLLVPTMRDGARSVGSAVHKGIETGSIDDSIAVLTTQEPTTQEERNRLDTDIAITKAMLTGYFEHFDTAFPEAEERIPELKFEVPIINPTTKATSRTYYLTGKADDLVKIDGQWWLVEHKTAGQIGKSYIDRLMLDSQITTYIYGIQRMMDIDIVGVIYRILRKPTIRQTQKETLDQYLNRLTQDYINRPDFYFYEEKLYRSQEDLKQFERELWLFTKMLLKMENESIYFKNTSRCGEYGGCMYAPLCKQEPDAEMFFTTEESNPELREGNVYVADRKNAS